jgi:hypothetical protein
MALIRTQPHRTEDIMTIRLLAPHHALRLACLYPNCVFAANGIEAMYDPAWVVSRTPGELLFLWAQFDTKLGLGWGADLKLSHRNKQWQNMAIDAVANAMLRDAGIGEIPPGAVFLEGVDASTSTEQAYDAVRAMWEGSVSQSDELGKMHLDPEDLQEIVQRQRLGSPLGRLTGGMLEEAISVQWNEAAYYRHA